MRIAVSLAVAMVWPGRAPGDKLERRPQNMVVHHLAIGDNPVVGPHHAPVTIDFFLTLQHRYDLPLYKNTLELARRHPRRVRIVYRFSSKSGRTPPAEAALEAFAQGRFLPFMNELAKAPKSRLPHRIEQLKAVCERAGIDFASIEEAWATGRHLAVLERNSAYLQQRHANHPPSLLLNGAKPTLQRSRTRTPLPVSDLEALYDQSYAAARRMLDDGVPLEHIYAMSLRDLDAARQPPRIRVGAVDGVAVPQRRNTLVEAPLVRVRNLGPGHEFGPRDARVVMRFYCSFASTRCAFLKHKIDELSARFPHRLRVSFHHMFPAEIDRDTTRALLLIHKASLCADRQGAFWRFYDAAYRVLHEHRRRTVPIPEQIRAILALLELDPERYQRCMSRPGSDEMVMERVRAGRKAGVVHTPTVVVGGRIYPGSKSLPELTQLVEHELMPGLLEQFTPTALE